MSVITTADEHRDEAKDAIGQAISHIASIVIEKSWGHDDFSDEYRKKLRSSLSILMDILEDL